MTLDSNILIFYLNDEPAVVTVVEEWIAQRETLFISSITAAEVLSPPGLTSADEGRILGFLGNFHTIPFDLDLARIAAMVRRVYGLKLADAAVAATALSRDHRLATRDRIFRRVKELEIVAV